MINSRNILFLALLFALTAVVSCRHKKVIIKPEPVQEVVKTDTLNNRCRLDYKSARTLSRHIKENEFKFEWIKAKANVTTIVNEPDGPKEENFDIGIKMRRDSVILVSIQYLLGLDVAKVLITRDTVVFVNYINKTYFKGDFNYINDLLNADLDYDVLQAVMFGNSAEFHDDEINLKPVADRPNCHYLLSTVRKRRLRRIQNGVADLKDALQILTQNPENYKILKNEFIEPTTNRMFIANYSNFTHKDSVYAPYHVDIDIVAQKKAQAKIDYVRIEKNTPQKIGVNIPAKYERIQIRQK